MSLVTIEDQSPTMRRAKMRLVLAVVLLIVAIGGLVSMSRSAPPKLDIATLKPVKKAPAPAAPVVVANKPAAVAPPPTAKVDSEPEAKPPQAPADPVYTSFTADPAYVAANPPATPATAPAEPDKPMEALAHPKLVQVTKAPVAPQVKADEKIEASANGKFLLQAGVFSDMENAKHQLEKLAEHHVDTHIESKVLIGPFSKTDGVEAARDKVDSAGLNITLDEVNGSKGTLLQAGLFTDMESAKQLQAKLSELGLTSRSETRILIGPFDTKAKADTVRGKVKALNISVVLL
ncbi:MAG TPA: SPOR domain-containing protein [Methylophilaceae bacterium]